MLASLKEDWTPFVVVVDGGNEGREGRGTWGRAKSVVNDGTNLLCPSVEIT